VAFDKDSKYMATAGNDSLIIIWDIRQQPSIKIAAIKSESSIRTIVFASQDTIISAREDGTIILSDIKQRLNIPLYNSSSAKPLCLAWNRNKKILFSGCSDGSIISIDLSKKITDGPHRYIVHTAGIDLITFNSDFSLLATSSWDKTISFYNYHEYFDLSNTVGGVEHLENLNLRTRSLIFTDDNKLIAGLSDKSIRVWETSSTKLSRMICDRIKRDMTVREWNDMVGPDIPYEKTCGK
jgi:WD40 repeat protein